MTIKFNNETVSIPESTTIEQFKALKDIPTKGTAFAVNGSLVIASRHAETLLHEGDDVVIITAAYGG